MLVIRYMKYFLAVLLGSLFWTALNHCSFVSDDSWWFSTFCANDHVSVERQKEFASPQSFLGEGGKETSSTDEDVDRLNEILWQARSTLNEKKDYSDSGQRLEEQNDISSSSQSYSEQERNIFYKHDYSEGQNEMQSPSSEEQEPEADETLLEPSYVVRKKNIPPEELEITLDDEHEYSRPEDIPTDNGEIIKIMDVMPLNGRQMYANFKHCENSACELTQDVGEATVFILNPGHTMAFPPRKPGDIWVMTTWEGSFNSKPLFLNSTTAREQFNWTHTVLSDSTFPARYGIVLEGKPPKKDYSAIFRAKKHDVAWMVSHCKTHSKREKYVDRMQSRIDVHIFGGCGNYTCGHSGMGGVGMDCMQLVSQHYKFYLAFENSFCRDYISEKGFFLYDPDLNTIPVVRGGANYSKFLPDDTYINAADFSSPEELATFLHRLGQDEKRYTDILKQKHHYYLGPRPAFLCQVCIKAHSNPTPHWYHDIHKWFGPERNCREATDL